MKCFWKRVVSALVSLALVFSIMPVAPVTVKAASQSDLTFELNSDGVSYSVTDCRGSASGTLSIPATYNGKPVTGIGDGAFNNCYSLTSVVIPEGVTRIGEQAFFCCYQLSNIIIPKSVTSIGDLAFCACQELTSVIVPEGVTTIGAGSFQGCSKLTSITLPASLTYIDPSAFWSCFQLQDLRLSEHNAHYSLDSKGVLFNKNRTELVYAPTACIGSFYAIPNSVTSIGEYAFRNCDMSSITIPEGVTTIGNGAFEACNDLVSITIPNSVTTIGSSAFEYCINLKSIVIGDSVTTIGNGVFYGCEALSSIQVSDNNAFYSNGAHGELFNKDKTKLICVPPERISGSYSVPNSVTYIGNYAFQRCTGLTAITIPNSVIEIGPYTFYACNKLTSIVIPENLLTVGNSAFHYCNSLIHVWYGGNENDRNNITVEAFGNSCFNDATWHYNCCDSDSHIYDKACDPVCNICGFIGIAAEHSYTNSCDTTCDVCGFMRAITHSYDNSCDTTCNVCGDIRAITHSYDNSCDTTCNVCGDIRAIEHSYDNDCDTTCNICSYGRTVADHVYTNSCDTTCNECGAVRSITHIYDYICDKTCNVCGHKRNASHVYDNANDLTCNECKQTLAPKAPKQESATDTAVTLVAVDGYEYSKDGTTWQKSNVFTGLQPFTSYDFYQRVAASPDNLVSPASLPLSVKTDKYMPNVPAAPTVSSKTGTSVTLQAQAGYEYSMDSARWQKSNVFTGLAPVTEYTFYQRIAETSNGYASAISRPITVTTLRTFTVTYDANGGDSVPDPQIKDDGIPLRLTSKTPAHSYLLSFKGWSTYRYGEVVYQSGDTYKEDKNITLYAVWYTACSKCHGDGTTETTCSECLGDGYYYKEYSSCCDYSVAHEIGNYGLPSSTICLYCRNRCGVNKRRVNCPITELVTCTSCKGAKYLKATPPAAPQPELLSVTDSSITVVAQAGMEYSIDGITWQASNVFEDLLPNTQYTIYQRHAENSYYNAGKSSEALLVSTLINYRVVFKDWNGTILSTKTYQYGDMVIAPANPIKATDHIASYTFAGWDKEVATNCAGDATYVATYTATYIDYTVVFKNWNGTVISTKTYHYGDTVTAPSAPTRPNDSQYSYTFTGWDKAVVNCAGNATYTAVYSAKSLVPSTITSSQHTVSGGTISKIGVGTKAETLLGNLGEGRFASIYQGNTAVAKSALIGTGMVVKIMDGSTTKVSATIVVTGDTNGDGKITITDMLAAKAHILKKSALNGAYSKAADTNGDGSISITDFIQLKAHILGKSKVEPKSVVIRASV